MDRKIGKWCSYNYAAKTFHANKLSSRLHSTEVEFYWQKQRNRVLCHPLGDFGVTYTVHLWLVGKRVVDFLLALFERFLSDLTVEALWANIGRNSCVWNGGVSLLSAHFSGNRGSSINDCWRQKTRVAGLLRGIVCVILRLAVLVQCRIVIQTDRRTDRRTQDDG